MSHNLACIPLLLLVLLLIFIGQCRADPAVAPNALKLSVRPKLFSTPCSLTPCHTLSSRTPLRNRRVQRLPAVAFRNVHRQSWQWLLPALPLRHLAQWHHLLRSVGKAGRCMQPREIQLRLSRTRCNALCCCRRWFSVRILTYCSSARRRYTCSN